MGCRRNIVGAESESVSMAVGGNLRLREDMAGRGPAVRVTAGIRRFPGMGVSRRATGLAGKPIHARPDDEEVAEVWRTIVPVAEHPSSRNHRQASTPHRDDSGSHPLRGNQRRETRNSRVRYLLRIEKYAVTSKISIARERAGMIAMSIPSNITNDITSVEAKGVAGVVSVGITGESVSKDRALDKGDDSRKSPVSGDVVGQRDCWISCESVSISYHHAVWIGFDLTDAVVRGAEPEDDSMFLRLEADQAVEFVALGLISRVIVIPVQDRVATWLDSVVNAKAAIRCVHRNLARGPNVGVL